MTQILFSATIVAMYLFLASRAGFAFNLRAVFCENTTDSTRKLLVELGDNEIMLT